MKALLTTAIAMFLGISAHCADDFQRISEEFANPPASARPYVWWHWMNGNVSKEGIRRDLLWMDSIGIAGLHQFDAAWEAVNPVMDRPVVYMSDEWKDDFRYAMELADSLGMEVGIAACPGFSSTGGPWVEPEDAMKKLVWRTVEVSGGGAVDIALPGCSGVVGVWQDFPRGKGYEDVPEWYGDVAVMAVRIQDSDMNAWELGAKASSSGGDVPDLGILNDGGYGEWVTVLRDDALGCSWLQYEYPMPVTVRAFRLSIEAKREIMRGKPAYYRSQLQCSDDGKVWKDICRIPDSIVPCLTMDITPATARYFRVKFMRRNDLRDGHKVREFSLFTTTKVDHAEAKAGFEAPHDLAQFLTPEASAPVAAGDVVDLGAFVKDGRIVWNAPEGRWRIYRFGASLTGKKNHPTIKDTEGLEVDKLDPEAWTRFFHNYLDLYREASGGLMGEHGIQYLLNDSYEAGQATWTPKMEAEFEARHGYALKAWLPALAGEIIGSTDESERFLHDWRETLGELFVENHDRLNGILAEYGIKGRYTESHENGHAYVGDGMDLKRGAAVPMSAFWFHNQGSGPVPSMSRADIKESASVAHIYGQNLVAAESFTVSGLHNLAYTYCPSKLKPLADFAFSCGLNRIVIHDSAHQPNDDAVPGTGLLRYGQWFNRHETWAGMAKPWMDYLARSCYMLQQGQYVADVLVYYGEDNSITGVYGHSWPDVAAGYSFDFVSPSALLDRVSARDGKMVTDTGMEYSVLYLGDNCKVMSVKILRKLAELAEAGVDICGLPPVRPASLEDDPQEFDRLVDSIWNSGREDLFVTHPHEHLAKLDISEDFRSDGDADFVHRRLQDGTDIYWVRNRSERDRNMTFSMRREGGNALVFDPVSGKSWRVNAVHSDGRTDVTMPMWALDAYFIVLHSHEQEPVPAGQCDRVPVGKFDRNGWSVKFEDGRGAPETAQFPQLVSWTESPDPGIRYYSGNATYTTTLHVTARELARARDLILDLGDVKEIAQVHVNGKDMGILWKSPWTIDGKELKEALKPGKNIIEVRVANLWVNRIIGDEQPGATRYTTTPIKFYSADSRLLESGLLGPVRLYGLSLR